VNFDFSIFVVYYEFLPLGQTENISIRLKKKEVGETSTLGFCITIMHRLTFHSFFVTISPKIRRIRSATTVFAWFGSVWLLAIP